jgi:hypothetical protein
VHCAFGHGVATIFCGWQNECQSTFAFNCLCSVSLNYERSSVVLYMIYDELESFRENYYLLLGWHRAELCKGLIWPSHFSMHLDLNSLKLKFPNSEMLGLVRPAPPDR